MELIITAYISDTEGKIDDIKFQLHAVDMKYSTIKKKKTVVIIKTNQ